MSRYRTTFLLLAVTASVGLAPGAHATGSGEVTFLCRGQYPAYPGFGTATCGYDVLSRAEVAASGTDDAGDAYVVAGAGDFGMTFGYSAPCVANEPPLISTIAGSASVTGVPAFANGASTRADLYVQFTATVLGAEAVLSVTRVDVSFHNGGSAAGGFGLGDVTIIPVAGPANICPSGGPMQALFRGDIGLAP